MTNASPELLSASVVAVRDCMGVQPGERVLVVTDEPLRAIGYALRRRPVDLGNDVLLVEMLPRKTNGEEPPPEVAELMTQFDVVLCPTSKSLTHTDSRRAASAKGVRVATLPGVTEEIMVRCMNADYHRDRRAHVPALRPARAATRRVRVTAPAGTDITMPIEGPHGARQLGPVPAEGPVGQPADRRGLPRSARGASRTASWSWTGRWPASGMVRQPLRIEVKDGYADGHHRRRGGRDS